MQICNGNVKEFIHRNYDNNAVVLILTGDYVSENVKMAFIQKAVTAFLNEKEQNKQ
jgi:hypothetical protein